MPRNNSVPRCIRHAGVSITKHFEFEAAHWLNNHPGACAEIHGHTYKCELAVEKMPGNPCVDMVMNFGDLSQIIKEHLLPHLDHKCLNGDKPNAYLWEEVVGYLRPTAEKLAAWIACCTNVYLEEHRCRVKYVRLWETSNSFTEVTPYYEQH